MGPSAQPRPVARRALLALVAVSLIAVASAVAGSAPRATAVAGVAPESDRSSGSAANGGFAGRVDIGGRHLYLECRGRGRPTVVLEAGLRSRGDIWSVPLDPERNSATVLDGVARFTRVCAYDRPGTTLGTDDLSRSDPAPMPRTAHRAVKDLDRLLERARVRKPYVLVGHSTGGLFVQLYARRHPRKVAGLVLVDALARKLRSAFSAGEWDVFKRLNTDPPPGLESYKDLEVVDFDTSYRQLRRAERRKPLRSIPLTVLSRAVPSELPSFVPPGYPEVFERVWQIGQRALAMLLPHARHVSARRSGHYVMLERPRLVAREIRRVVAVAPRR